MAAFSGGEVQTLMSVDADRVVNLCQSLHELWSLPLQIAAALFLLYTQVRRGFSDPCHLAYISVCHPPNSQS